MTNRRLTPDQRAEVARVRSILRAARKPDGYTGPVWTTCGTCGRKWDDARISELTPTPAARCPFEYAHTSRENEPAASVRNRLTMDSPTLFIDQFGQKVIASTLAELREKAGPGRVSKQYVDKKDGRTVWNGYVIGSRWFTAFKWAEVED